MSGMQEGGWTIIQGKNHNLRVPGQEDLIKAAVPSFSQRYQ